MKKELTKTFAIISMAILALLLLAACGPGTPPEAETQPAQADDGSSEINNLLEESETAVDEQPSSQPDALPASVETDANGVPVGFTESGNPYRGSLDAPVVIEEFSDFQ
jgi:protein-disulfide isomerase